MNRIAAVVALIVCLLGAASVSAEEIKVQIDGKEVTLQRTSLNHEIKEADRKNGDQTSAMKCSFMLYDLLAKGDIEGAAKLTADPADALATYKQYQERVGADKLTDEAKKYFTSQNVVVAEIVLGGDIMLVIKTGAGKPSPYVAQFFQKKDDKYFLNDEAAKVLHKVLNMILKGTFKIEATPVTQEKE